MDVPVRFTGILALIALVPVAIYLLGTGQADPLSTALTGVNVVLITVSLFLLFGPDPSPQAQTNGATS